MDAFIERFINPSQQSYFLFGPRGTGKSTWLQKQYPGALSINLLKPDVSRSFLARPERLEEVVKGTQAKTIIIDEIQKAPELLTVVHSLIEEKQGWQFILTGSSARKLKRAGVDLLAGRALRKYLHPFMAGELGAEFSLTSALQYGLVPLIVDSPMAQSTLNAYIGLYLEEEVRAEGLVRNIGDFSRFLEVASFSHGSILNVTNIARECEVSRKLIEGYLSVLQDLLLCFFLPVFSLRAQRKIISHPKFYYFDTGVYKHLRATGFLDNESEINGAGLEGLVAQHLVAWNDYQDAPYKLYYWRTQHGVEVDFVVYGPKGFYAIEVKNSATIHPKDLTGLKSFCEDYPEATPLLLYRGKERLQKNTILCMPVDEFLVNLRPARSLMGEDD